MIIRNIASRIFESMDNPPIFEGNKYSVVFETVFKRMPNFLQYEIADAAMDYIMNHNPELHERYGIDTNIITFRIKEALSEDNWKVVSK